MVILILMAAQTLLSLKLYPAAANFKEIRCVIDTQGIVLNVGNSFQKGKDTQNVKMARGLYVVLIA